MSENCPFCDRKQFEERLIAKTEGFYIIATLGQITDSGYVLLFPVEHTLCMGALSREQTSTMLGLAKKICSALTQKYKLEQARQSLYPITLFEHGIVGQTIKHAHLHLLPTILDLTQKIQDDFPESKIEELQYASHLQELYRKRPEPYLYWGSGEENNSKARVCWNPNAPAQYLRIITAQALNRPERANWRQMDAELDRKLWTETVKRLRPHFNG